MKGRGGTTIFFLKSWDLVEFLNQGNRMADLLGVLHPDRQYFVDGFVAQRRRLDREVRLMSDRRVMDADGRATAQIRAAERPCRRPNRGR